MSLKLRYVAPLLAPAWAATSIAIAPLAAADEPVPEVGQSPEEAIQALEAQGYNVAVNWTTGYPDVPLSECTLRAIHNPDGSGPKTNTTVYLDISCPSDNFD
jgi:ABC-type hemin transport system substrate-binding protein